MESVFYLLKINGDILTDMVMDFCIDNSITFTFNPPYSVFISEDKEALKELYSNLEVDDNFKLIKRKV